MPIEHILIAVGGIGIAGSLVAIAMGYLVHLNEERDRQWWEARNIDFSDGASRNGSYTTASQKTAPKELRSACADAEVISGDVSRGLAPRVSARDDIIGTRRCSRAVSGLTSGGMAPSVENTNRKESSTSKRH